MVFFLLFFEEEKYSCCGAYRWGFKNPTPKKLYADINMDSNLDPNKCEELNPETEDQERKRHNRAVLIVLTRFSFEISPRSIQEIFTEEEMTRFFRSTCVVIKMIALANAGKPANPQDVVEAIRGIFLETKVQVGATSISKGHLSERSNAALVKKTKKHIDVLFRRSMEAREFYLQEQQLQKDSKFPLSKDDLDAQFASVYPFLSKSQMRMYGEMAEIRKAYEMPALQYLVAAVMADKETAEEIVSHIEAMDIREVNERQHLENERRQQVAKRVEEARQKQRDRELERKQLEKERKAAHKKRREDEAREKAVAALIKRTAADAVKSVVSAAAAAAAARERASEQAFQEVYNANRAAAQRRGAALKERERLAAVEERAERRRREEKQRVKAEPKPRVVEAPKPKPLVQQPPVVAPPVRIVLVKRAVAPPKVANKQLIKSLRRIRCQVAARVLQNAARSMRLRRLEATSSVVSTDDFLCAVCMDRPKNALATACRHLAICMECSVSLAFCPMCRAPSPFLEVFL